MKLLLRESGLNTRNNQWTRTLRRRIEGTFNYGLTIPLSPPLEVLWWHRQAPQVAWMLLNRLHLVALERLLNLGVSLAEHQCVRTPAMLQLPMMTTPATIANNNKVCLACLGGSRLPGCTYRCHLCTTQRCGLRDVHNLHLCKRRPAADPAPVGDGGP